MRVSEEQVEKVLSGKVQCRFTQLGFSMLVTRLMMVYRNNPSGEMLRQCTMEINNFISKFSSVIMSDYELFRSL